MFLFRIEIKQVTLVHNLEDLDRNGLFQFTNEVEHLSDDKIERQIQISHLQLSHNQSETPQHRERSTYQEDEIQVISEESEEGLNNLYSGFLIIVSCNIENSIPNCRPPVSSYPTILLSRCHPFVPIACPTSSALSPSNLTNAAQVQQLTFLKTELAPLSPHFQLSYPERKIKAKGDIRMTAISASGHLVAVLMAGKFWIFRSIPVTLVCVGVFRKAVYHYAKKDSILTPQIQAPKNFSEFSCVALSDEFLAVGVDGMVLIFVVQDCHCGQWVVCNEIHNARQVLKLQFSADGIQLAALIQTDEGEEIFQKVIIYFTASFPKTSMEGFRSQMINGQTKLAPNYVEVRWKWNLIHRPTAMTFSMAGTMIAISTTHSEAMSEILILRENNNVWQLWGVQAVRVFTHDPTTWHGSALMGISLCI